jgi:hypothetical protein
LLLRQTNNLLLNCFNTITILAIPIARTVAKPIST